MKTSRQGIEFIASFEGFVDHPYQDSGGVWTIGYGHTGPGTGAMGRITHAKGLALLARDVRSAEAAVDDQHLRLTQSQFDALVSIVFNCGPGILHPSRTLGSALANGMRGVPAAMKVYTHDAAGHELAGLVRRRNAEAALWDKPQPEGPAAWLTRKELALCRRFDELAEIAHRTPRQQSALDAVAADIKAQRKRIWRSAQKPPKGDGRGWLVRNRDQRYRSLRARTA
jgi:lysozyme